MIFLLSKLFITVFVRKTNKVQTARILFYKKNSFKEKK